MSERLLGMTLHPSGMWSFDYSTPDDEREEAVKHHGILVAPDSSTFETELAELAEHAQEVLDLIIASWGTLKKEETNKDQELGYDNPNERSEVKT